MDSSTTDSIIVETESNETVQQNNDPDTSITVTVTQVDVEGVSINENDKCAEEP